MQRRHREVKRLIRDQEKTAIAQTEELQLQLEKEITKLRRQDTELELLSHADDHIHFIQVHFLVFSDIKLMILLFIF